VSNQVQQTHSERLQAEIAEIAEVLSRRSGKPIAVVWNEALGLHRVRYETKVLTDKEEKENK
jgi:hypothetical protein